MTTVQNRIDAFWEWIQQNSETLRSAVLDAQEARAAETLQAVASAIYERAAQISAELLVDLQSGPQELILAVRGSSAADESLARQVLASAPRLNGWRFAAEVPRDLVSVIARDESGRELVVPYAALTFAISRDESNGSHTILIVFDGDFELDGPDRHLFDHVAEQVVLTLVGRIPHGVAAFSLVPARMAVGVHTRPILELRTAWSLATQAIARRTNGQAAT